MSREFDRRTRQMHSPPESREIRALREDLRLEREAVAGLVRAGDELRMRLETATATVRALAEIISRNGGFLSPEDQDTLRAARKI